MTGGSAVVPPLHTPWERDLDGDQQNDEPTRSGPHTHLGFGSSTSSFARCRFSHHLLTPISRRYRVAPTERAQKVLLPWGNRLTVFWSLVSTSVPELSVNVKCFGLGRGSTPPTPQTRNGHSSPASRDGGLLAGVGNGTPEKYIAMRVLEYDTHT